MPTASNILCGCGRFLRVKKNSVTVEELTEDGQPYKLWDADLWECPECGVEIIAGFGQGPIAEHYQEQYAATKARLGQERIYPGRCREEVPRGPISETAPDRSAAADVRNGRSAGDATDGHESASHAETWNTCPDCGFKWKDDTSTPGLLHRTRMCAVCAEGLVR
jgi:hypothetical protein